MAGGLARQARGCRRPNQAAATAWENIAIRNCTDSSQPVQAV